LAGAPVHSAAAASQPTQRYIVVWADSVDPDTETDDFERLANAKADFRYSHAIKGFAAALNSSQLAVLSRHPKVKFVSPDEEVHAIGSVPIVAGDSAPTGVRRIDAASTTNASEASTVGVAVIDTGIQLNHPDLNAVAGKNCITSGASPSDDNGHGTHVSGTIGARNNGAGVVGVAPGTTLYAVKVLNAQGSGSWGQVICGIDWVTANAGTLNIKVASMSLGGGGSNDNNCGNSNFDALHQAICRSTAAGVTYVVAAGNSGANFAGDAPASYPEALTVTAMSDSDGLAGGTGGAPTCRTGETDDASATFSNFAAAATEQNHTVAGPGVCIRSTWLNGGYNTISGTSMATPHVSGTVALCIGSGGAAGPCSGMAPAQIIQKIRADAQARATVSNGFSGDPLHPVSGRYFGFLASAGAYNAPDTTPPLITAVNATPTSTTGKITWTTNEPASSQVDSWIDPAVITSTPVTDTSPRVTSHTVTISGLSPSTTYGYRVKSVDSSNNAAQSADLSFKTAAASSYDLSLSTSANRSSASPLQGQTVAGTIYVFVSPATGVTQTRFWLDNPQMTGSPIKTEWTAPWDFAGTASNGDANPYSTTALANGSHTISVAIDKTGGGTDIVSATFSVANSAPPPPPPSAFSLQVSSSADRSAPAALDGKTVSGTIYVFVGPASGVTQVRFYLDNPQRTGTPTKTEYAAAWDFAGTASSGNANPYSTTALANGTHTISVAIDKSGGGTDLVSASFTVAN
jgi:subtilisin family serine protease